MGGIEMLCDDDRAGNEVGSVTTSVESASIPPADEPTTTSWDGDAAFSIRHSFLET